MFAPNFVPRNYISVAGLQCGRLRAAFLSWFGLAMLLTSLMPSPQANAAGIASWSAFRRIGAITNPAIRVRPSDGKTVILGALNNSNPATAGIFMFTSDDNFQSVRQLTPATNYPGFDTAGAPRAVFDLAGNLHIFWDSRPSGFVVNYLKLDANLQPVGSIRNLNQELYGASGVQPADPDVAAATLPGGDGRLYLTMAEYPNGVGIWESLDGGATWGNRFVPTTSGYLKSNPRIAAGPNGEVHVAYSPNLNGGLFIASKIPSKANQNGFDAQGWKIFNIPLFGGNPNINVKAIAAGADGRAYVSWIMGRGSIAANYDTASLVRWDVASSSWLGRVDNASREPGNDYNIMRTVALAAGADGTVVLTYPVFNYDNGGGRVRYSVSTDGGANWSNPANMGYPLAGGLPISYTDLYFDGKNRFHYLATFRSDYDTAAFYSTTNGGGFNISTPKTAVNALPANTTDNSGQFDVSWGRTDGNTGELIRYTIEYRDVTANGQWQIFRRTSGTAATFSNGIAGHKYEFRSSGNNGSQETTHTTADASTTVASSPAPTVNGYFHIGKPTRLYDSRSSGGVLAAGSTRTVQIAGQAAPSSGATPVPVGATAAIMNVTVTDTTAGGFLAAFPAGTNWQGNASINWTRAGAQVGNLVIGQRSAGGQINFLAGGSAANIVVDILGYTDANSQNASYYQSLTAPVRLYDSRTADGKLNGASQQSRTIQVAGTNGIPSGAQAIFVNATAAGTTDGGFITLYPGGNRPAGTASVNYVGNAKGAPTVGNFTLAALSADGKLTMQAGGAGRTDVVLDVVGYLDSNPSGGTYHAVIPERLYDSRPEVSGEGVIKPVAPNVSRTLDLSGYLKSGAKAALLNVTAANITTGGFIALYPSGTNWPNNSNLNFALARDLSNIRTAGNFAFASLNTITSNNQLNITAGGDPAYPGADLIIDISGYIG